MAMLEWDNEQGDSARNFGDPPPQETTLGLLPGKLESPEIGSSCLIETSLPSIEIRARNMRYRVID